ncbi:two-component sensor histidine kinase [Actinomyces oris]|uniref:histidine kinase n=1 Tax=Actinomyces oris TaxID=544580 RepID=A0A1Q8W4E0_9ACTO|nr:two-component sensor histidine kinase [Actinomyces oris]
MTVAPASPAPYAPVRPAPSFTQSLSPSQRHALQVTLTILRSLGLFALCAMGFLIALGTRFGHEQVLKESHHPVLEAAGFLTGLGLLVAVFLRGRWPVPITVASALAGIGVYLDTTVGLIAFTTVVRRARSLRDPVPWATGALLAVGTLVALFRDASYGATGNSMIGAFNSSPPLDPHAATHVSVPQVLFLAVVGMSLPVAVGLWLRARDGEKKARRRAREAADASAQAERTAQEQTRTSTRLADTVSLQAERERVAREVHDGLGHRLSLLALHAAALEQGVLETSENTNAPEGSDATDSADALGEDDPRAAAQRVRQEAQGAMRDLRSLLAVLREPVGAVEPAPRLEDLREVVDGVLAARQPLSSSIYLDRAAQADEVLSRAVYRIVQESLTNARKHSPGTSVQLRVEGGPDTGIDITCSNRISRTESKTHDAEAGEGPQAAGADRGAASGPGVTVGDPQSGSGLRGMAQRAAICGGTFHAGPDGQGRFVVSAHLPWRSAESLRTDR